MKSILIIIAVGIAVMLVFAFGGLIAGFAALIAAVGFYVYRSYPLYLMFRGNIAYKDDPEKGMEYLNRAYVTGRLNKEHITSYAYMCLREGQAEKARKIIDSLLTFKQGPEIRYPAKITSALVNFKLGGLDEAIAESEEVLANYKNTTLYSNLGYFKILKGDLREALKFNLEAMEYNSDSNVITDNLANNYFLLGEYEKARELYEKMFINPPEFPVPYYHYAQVLEKLGDTGKARELLEIGLQYKFTALAAVTEDELENMLKRMGGDGAEVVQNPGD